MAAFRRVLRSGQFILGPEVAGFEETLAGFLGVEHTIGVSSGTDAILLALMALGIGPGDEVICPSFTFFATAGCIARVGARPVFVDSCPVCFNLDVADVGRKVSSRTKAIMPVHLYGQAADLDPLMRLAATNKLAVIEDAAQSLGAEFRGRKVGGIGTFGAFSFFPTKNLGACGDAGLLVTNDSALAERARLLRTHGARQRYYHEVVGGNFRLDALQAALLQVKWSHYSTYTARRQENAAFYMDQLTKLSGVVLADLSHSVCHPGADSTNRASALAVSEAHLILPVAYPHNGHTWNQFTVRVRGQGRRDAMKRLLAERGIGSETYYPVPMHRQQCFAPPHGAIPELPVADALAGECLSLPIYPELTREQLSEVVSTFGSFLSARP
jgi:dTDP-4-amino-4,6-dideoxygalactose transaminase